MKRDSLNTPFGINFVAIGIVAVLNAVLVVVFHDIYFLATGATGKVWLPDQVLAYALVTVAAIFSIANIFILRRGLPKYVAGILAASLTSLLVQPLLPLHSYRQVALLCGARIIGCSSILLLAGTYVLDRRAERAARRCEMNPLSHQ